MKTKTTATAAQLAAEMRAVATPEQLRDAGTEKSGMAYYRPLLETRLGGRIATELWDAAIGMLWGEQQTSSATRDRLDCLTDAIFESPELDTRIEALMTEAHYAGDVDTVELCRTALAGVSAARYMVAQQLAENELRSEAASK